MAQAIEKNIHTAGAKWGMGRVRLLVPKELLKNKQFLHYIEFSNNKHSIE
jgi:hypothetical protein